MQGDVYSNILYMQKIDQDEGICLCCRLGETCALLACLLLAYSLIPGSSCQAL